jgi:hypothetical protein
MLGISPSILTGPPASSQFCGPIEYLKDEAEGLSGTFSGLGRWRKHKAALTFIREGELNGLSSIVHSNRPLPRTDSSDGLEALTPREWVTSSERHQANTKSQVGVWTSARMRRTGGNARHRWT